MSELTPQGRRVVEEMALRYGIGVEAVLALLRALVAGHGTMAQFGHPELGGSGQWTLGGMIMISDMFNHALKAKIDQLATELSALLASGQLLVPTGARQTQSQSSGTSSVSGFAALPWWGAGLGEPAAQGAQNATRYAYFPEARRLAVESDGVVTVYDTGDHRITGAAQQQGGETTLRFLSQHGVVGLGDLATVAGPGIRPALAAGPSPDDIFFKLERLADLHAKGVLSDQEYSAKKSELLSRL